MENYGEFLSRINAFEKSGFDLFGARFTVNQSLAQKTGENNKFKSFYGDTVVFGLNGDTKAAVSRLIDFLYESAPECFCERLKPDTLHMTLHDLSNSAALCDIADELRHNERAIAKIKAQTEKLAGGEIRMKCNAVFNMVNTSLVLGLYPADKIDYGRLIELYSVIDGIKPLSYPFTPHITLAYYNIGGFDEVSAASLASAVEECNANLDAELVLGGLYYQRFSSMNDYVNITKLSP